MEFVVRRTQRVETRRRRNVNVSLETSLADADWSLLPGTLAFQQNASLVAQLLLGQAPRRRGKRLPFTFLHLRTALGNSL